MKPLLTTRDAARILGLSPRTLDKWRVSNLAPAGGGPEFLKIGGKVFYRQESLEAWLETRRRRSTSDHTVKAAA